MEFEWPAPDVLITLVHGTFARKADWLEQSSNICSRLKDLLAPRPVTVEPFRWSGKNSFKAREVATDEFGHYLKQPAVRLHKYHIVVAHSHGGNVVLQALQDPEAESSVSAVITMATPFLHVRPRRLPATVSVVMSSLTILVALLYGVAVGYPLYYYHAPLPFLLIVAVITALSIARVTLRAAAESKPRIISFLDKHRVPFTTRVPLLSIRAPGDEASGILVSAQFAVWLANAIWHMLARFLEKGRWVASTSRASMGVNVGVTLAAATAGLVSAISQLDDGPRWLIRGAAGLAVMLLSYWPLAFGVLVLATITAAVLTPFMIMFTAICALPYGNDMALYMPFADITAEPAPVGQSSIVMFPALARRGLMHSWAYESDEVLDFLVYWMRGIVLGM